MRGRICMFCPECGKNIKDESKFCPFCGTFLDEEIVKVEKNAIKDKKKLLKWIIIAGTVIIISAIIAILYVNKKNEIKKNNYQALMEEGNNYLEELDYEGAEANYLQAIKVEPKNVEAYEKLVQIYTKQGEKKKAKEILETAVKNLKVEQVTPLQKQYDMYIYVEEVLIPEYGECEAGEYESSYIKTENYIRLDSLHSEQGVMTWRIMDFDHDEENELLVLMLKNDEIDPRYSWNEEVKHNVVYLQMYENNNGEIVLVDEYKGLSDVLGAGDIEDDGVFLHEHENNIYICGSNKATTYLYADGTTLKSFILTYENEKFLEKAGELEEISASDFYGVEQTSEYKNMIEVLNEIGLEEDAKKISETKQMVFDFDDKQDEMIMRIQGENVGYSDGILYDFETIPNGKLDFMGVVKLTVTYFLEKTDDSEQEEQKEEIDLTDLYNSEYGPLLDEAKENLESQILTLSTYYCYDIDKDGIEELFLPEGTCEGDYKYNIYTLKNNKRKFLGDISGFHTAFYADENGGTEKYIIKAVGFMGYQALYHVKIEDEQVICEEILSKDLDLSTESYYGNPYPIEKYSLDKYYAEDWF